MESQHKNSFHEESGERQSDSIDEEQLNRLAENVGSYLSSLYHKAGLMVEGTYRPILTPEEHSYVNHAISAAAHLVRYWVEYPHINMPPAETLNSMVAVLQQYGIEFSSPVEEVVKEPHIFASLLNRVATKGDYTSRLQPRTNRSAVACARELVSLLPVIAAYNGHRLPTDYSVRISLDMLRHLPGNQEDEVGAEIKLAIQEVLDGLEPDHSGYIRLNESRRLQLENAFKASGLAIDRPTPEETKAGIEAARFLVREGRAEDYLKEMPFMAEMELPEKKERRYLQISLDYPIYIVPEAIAGTIEFQDWGGYPAHTKKNDDMGDSKPSIEVIKDYATRGTALPASVINLIFREKDIVLYGDDSHRAAAARLRSEPLAVHVIKLYK